MKYLNLHTIRTMMLDFKHVNNFAHVRYYKTLTNSGQESFKWLMMKMLG